MPRNFRSLPTAPKRAKRIPEIKTPPGRLCFPVSCPGVSYSVFFRFKLCSQFHFSSDYTKHAVADVLNVRILFMIFVRDLICRHQLKLMEIQTVHTVNFLFRLFVFALSCKHIVIEHSIGESDLILIRHTAQPV